MGDNEGSDAGNVPVSLGVKRMCKYYFIQVLFFVKFYFYWQSVHHNLLPPLTATPN